ncbi:ABC transporter permease [Actinomadura kijaniata]|uniref:FtsX-like permease family protein n=1 Tax=Actinomadura kijaniata TaxID=46161 RepID=UPI002FEC196B
MWHPGLVARRMTGAPAVVVAASATVLFAITVLAAMAGYTGSVTREGVRRTLGAAPFEAAGTRIAARVPAGQYDAARERLVGGLRQIYGDLPLNLESSAYSDSYTLPGQEERERPELAVFAAYTSLERHVRLVAGRWPDAAPAGEVQAVLPAPAARAMRVEVGRTLTMRGRVDEDAVVRVRIVGLFAPLRADDPLWQGDPLVAKGVTRLDYTTYGPLVVRPETFASRLMGGGVEVRWTVLPGLGRVDTAGLTALRARLDGSGPVFQRLGRETGTTFTTATELPALLHQLETAVTTTRSTMLMPVIQLVLLAGYALALVARLLADQRRAEVALLRMRGASLGQLAGLTLAEWLVIVLPGAVLSPLLAAPLLRLAGRAPAVRAAGLTLDAGALAPLWGVSAAAALACALLLTVPTLRGAMRTFAETQAGLGGTRGPALRRGGADLALLLVAALGVWQLTRYGAGGTAGVDPFIVSGPALALLAGGMLLLRLLPPATRAAEHLTRRRRGLAASLSVRQVSRRPLRYAGPALLLVMATAVGVLSVTTMATWRVAQVEQADFQSGTDLRLLSADDTRTVAPMGQGGRYAALPGVTGAAGVRRQDATYGQVPTTMVAAAAARLQPLLRARPDLRRELALRDLAARRPALPAATVPGTPRTLTLDLRLTATGSGSAGGSAGRRYLTSVSLTDGNGAVYRVDLPELTADGRTRAVEIDTAALAGPQGRITYPLGVRGMTFPYDGNPPPDGLELSLERARGDAGEATAPSWARVDTFVTTEDLEDNRTVGGGTAGTGARPLLTMRIGPAPRTEGRGLLRTAVHGLLSAPDPPDHTAAPDRRPAVPAVITDDLASRARVGVGGALVLRAPDGDVRAEVVGIARALPTLPPDRPAVLFDLPTLADRHLAFHGTPAESLQPREWWAAADGARTGPAVRAVRAAPGLGTVAGDRPALRRALLDAPLGAALQGALVLGFGAALAFAVIAFVVNGVVAAHERSREFTVLRALGVPPGKVAGMLAIEQAFLVALGLLGGLGLGLLVAWLVVGETVQSVRAAQAVPAFPAAEPAVPWPPVLGMAAGIAAVLALVLAVLLRTLRRRGLGGDLRAGEDR